MRSLLSRATFILLISALAHQATAQETVQSVVYTLGSDGSQYPLVASADDDGDGIENAMEINGYTYDPSTGLQAWNGDTSVAYYVTDPRRWSTDGDPYSDFMEVSGVNMPGSVKAPYTHPLVAARPKISMYMFDYDVIPIAEITDSNGGSTSESYTNSTTNEDQVGGSVTVEAELNPFKLAKASVEVNYSHTWINTEETTNTSETNWETATTTNPSEAARLKLRVYMENLGSADASDVTPTFNLLLGKKVIATITSPEQANILSSAGTTNSRYPATGGIVIDKDDSGAEIILSMNELRAIESGAPLSMVVTQVSANVLRWDSDTQQFNTDLPWEAFENDIDPVTMMVQADVGTGERAQYQIFAGTQFYDPEFTLEDVLSMVFDVQTNGSNATMEGRAYPQLWYHTTDSQFLIDAWTQAGEPDNMFGLPAEEGTFLSLVSPPLNPDPLVNLASFSSDMRNVLVSATPSGGFPIISVEAQVQIEGVNQTIDLIQPNGFPYFLNENPFSAAAGAKGSVVVTDASGESVTHDIALPFIANATCADVAGGQGRLPRPGAEYILFVDGDLGRPALGYCTFYDEEGNRLASPLTNFWIDYSIPYPDYNINFEDVYMLDEQTIVAVGSDGSRGGGAIYRSEDRGKNWILLEPPPGIGRLVSVEFLPDGKTGIISGAESAFLLTSDGGKTWRVNSGGGITSRTLYRTFYVSPDTVFAFGEDRQLVSYNGGETWPGRITLPNSSGNHRDAEMSTVTGTIIVIGGAGSIYRSGDRGESWQKVNSGVTQLVDVSNAYGPVWVATGWSAMYRSTDDGLTWSEFTVPGGTTSFNAVDFASSNVGYALDWKSMYRTEDGWSDLAINRNDDSGYRPWALAVDKDVK